MVIPFPPIGKKQALESLRGMISVLVYSSVSVFRFELAIHISLFLNRIDMTASTQARPARKLTLTANQSMNLWRYRTCCPGPSVDLSFCDQASKINPTCRFQNGRVGDDSHMLALELVLASRPAVVFMLTWTQKVITVFSGQLFSLRS
jgi:hypothetical protein